MNFLFLKNAINVCKKYRTGKKLLSSLTKGKFKKESIDTSISIKEFSQNNYLGYTKKESILINKLIIYCLQKVLLKK